MKRHSLAGVVMIDILERLTEVARKESRRLRPEVMILRGVWRTTYVLRLNLKSTTFFLNYLLAQTVGQGCSYYDSQLDEPGISESLLGKNILEVKTESRSLQIAMLDAAFSSFRKPPSSRRYTLTGSNIEKADARAKIICKEALSWIRQKGRRRGGKLKILHAGVVGNILSELAVRKDTEILATDFYEGIVGKTLFGVRIEHGSKTPDLVAQADLAIITGMSLANDTLDTVLDAALENKTSLAVFAETGANFAYEYCRMGIDLVISEPFPFYLSCPGTTIIDIYRRPS
jgi:hypothetical protein